MPVLEYLSLKNGFVIDKKSRQRLKWQSPDSIKIFVLFLRNYIIFTLKMVINIFMLSPNVPALL